MRRGSLDMPQGPRRAATAWAAAGLVAVMAAGCQVRDEPVKSPDGPTFWPRTARGQTGVNRTDGTAAEVAYLDGYESAARRARADGRPLLLVFRASWCRWSGALSSGPLADPRLVTLTRRCVCAQVDADRDADTCRAFAVSAFPTVIIVAADGRECFRGTGAGATAGLVAALDAVPPAGTVEDRLAAEERPAGGSGDVTR